MTRFGIATMPRSARETIEIAQTSEACGFTTFGVGDGHFLHHELYSVVTAVLCSTSAIAVGPTTTNNVARRWSVHASAARTLDELCPGRFFLGLSTGDGSVRSIGCGPQPWPELADDAARIRARVPDGVRIQCAASGLRGARSAGTWADALVVGTGADAAALNNLADAARAARASSPLASPIEVWALLLAIVVDDESAVAATREHVRVGAYGSAHFAFASTFEGKNVPAEYQDPIRDGLSRYDYRYHGVQMAENPNAQLLSDQPDVADYLVDRMCIVGTEADVRTRVRALCSEARLDGVWMHAGSVAGVHRLAEVCS
jgi:alkanesulfonate monooxygenase SsuD/methylene tetrahydromethanopterin reductase-like flavin-dependent oxidoreductase (luciferase family)